VPEVDDRPHHRRGESGPAVHVRQMIDIPCGGRFSRAHTGRATSHILGKSRVCHTNARFRRSKCAHRRLQAPPQQTGRCRWVPPMWGPTPDTSDRIVKVKTRNPASQLPAKSRGFLGFPIQNGYRLMPLCQNNEQYIPTGPFVLRKTSG
jgi:hypothetical protein